MPAHGYINCISTLNQFTNHDRHYTPVIYYTLLTISAMYQVYAITKTAIYRYIFLLIYGNRKYILCNTVSAYNDIHYTTLAKYRCRSLPTYGNRQYILNYIMLYYTMLNQLMMI